MYLDFYGLKNKPFTLSPDPKYLYYSSSHKEAVSQFIYSITQQNGFMVLTGEVGTGKTTLINAMLDCLPDNFLVAKIFHTVLSPKGLIQNVCKEFKITFSSHTMAELIFKLHEHLMRNCRAGRKCILILDEAQNLKPNILEEIRLLSNFEAKNEKYLHIILVGQPELDTRLEDVNLRQLRDRVGFKYTLNKLNQEETLEYISHRLKVAGFSNSRHIFTEEAVERIYSLSEGIPRHINILCENALLLSYAENSQTVDAETIEKVKIDDASFANPSKAETTNENLSQPAEDHLDREAGPNSVRSGEPLTVKDSASNEDAEYRRFEKRLNRFLKENKLLVVKKSALTLVLITSALMMLFLHFVVFLFALYIGQRLDVLR
ncbi:AAA family ATPase [candidate division KSB1 bacterium]|nr:AAA family ATPase [candidate division KSB1 bacterium]NIR68864.1 AAA family ATPase [candidate division KSB1 bacterium]NIS27232.1 AAA family ATPase [candidate division KSB1 bacterium]NIT74117.1 AAA family ATPase [candidate division KSB1 bacterium]NIU27966.1 AAA family ATPase [candidate division KSB1 bacterium]